jgi:ribosome maturation factor RimP
MFQDILLKLRSIFASYLEKGGYVLVDMRFYRAQSGASILEVLADRAEGDIRLDECVRLNRELGAVMDASGVILDRYTLDVSSPGMDRPLVTVSDFKRVLGKPARFFLGEAVEERIEYEGVIVGVNDLEVTVQTKQKTIQIPLDKINKAKQVIV